MAPAWLVLGIAAAGCGFRITANPVDAQADAPAVTPDGSAPQDTSGGACTPIITAAPGLLVAPRVTAPMVDGDLAEWSTCFIPLNATSAGLVRLFGAMTPTPLNGSFSVAHDGTRLYIAARATFVAAPGDDLGNDIYRNDSVAVYIDADGMTVPGYGNDATQIVVDHQGRTIGFRDTLVVPVPMRATAVTSTASDYAVELSVAPATFGVGQFATTIGFDFAFNDGDGIDQLAEIIWFQRCSEASTPPCGCSSGDDAPYCDSRQFGSLMFGP